MKMKLTVLFIFLTTINSYFSLAYANEMKLFVIEEENFSEDKVCHIISYDKLLANNKEVFIPLISPAHTEPFDLSIQARRYDDKAYFTASLYSDTALRMDVNTSYTSYDHVDLFSTNFYVKAQLEENNEVRDVYRRISLSLGLENLCEVLKYKSIIHDL